MSKEDPFAELAPIYDAVFPRIVPKYREAIDLMLSLLPFPADASVRVAELGCGTGEVLHSLAKSFVHAELLGYDLSGAMLDQARKKLAPFASRVKLEQVDLRHQWPESLVDVHAVLCPYVMEYFPTEAQHKLVQNAYESLRAGGRFMSIEFVQAVEPRINQVFRDLEYRLVAEALQKGRISKEQLDVLIGLADDGPKRFAITLEERMDGLKRAGFERVEVAWRFLNFVLITAAKPVS